MVTNQVIIYTINRIINFYIYRGNFYGRCTKDKERGTYFFIVRVRQFDGTLKQVKRRGFKTKKEAREAEAKMLIEKETNSSLTFSQVADSYFDWYSQRRKESSISYY